MEGGRPDRADDVGSIELTDLAEMRAALAQAEAEASEADALAEAARARALQVDSDPADLDGTDRPDAPESDPSESVALESETPEPEPTVSKARPVMTRQVAGLALAALLTAAASTLTGLMIWQHSRVLAQRAQDQQFLDAARDGILALLSIDHTHAQADVQRILELSTGQFHADFSNSADDFAKTAEGARTVSKGTVKVAALESVDGDRGVVLVAAVSEVSNANGARQDPRPFRINVTVTREGGTCKMSDVEFVP